MSIAITSNSYWRKIVTGSFVSLFLLLCANDASAYVSFSVGVPGGYYPAGGAVCRVFVPGHWNGSYWIRAHYRQTWCGGSYYNNYYDNYYGGYYGGFAPSYFSFGISGGGRGYHHHHHHHR